jgi:signal transduction histidine kinase
MRLDDIKQRAWLSWVCVSVLVVLCSVLAVLQYRWIGEVANAEQDRLRGDLQSRLGLLRRSFNDQVSNACSAFVPPASQIEKVGRDQAYAEQFRGAPESAHKVVRRVALAIPQDGHIVLSLQDSKGERFSPADWPADWVAMENRLYARLRNEPVDPNHPRPAALVEFPRFGVASNATLERRGIPEQEWLILELNLDYVRGTLLPATLDRYLGDAVRMDYDTEIIDNVGPSAPNYQLASGDRNSHNGKQADAWVTLFEVAPLPFGPGPGVLPGPSPPPDRGHGAWVLLVQHHAGSLDAIVAQARRRNIALSAGLLLLILAMVVSLIRFSRAAQRMAELQMNFVAGVSHELRTPLTVIRTAAFNLRGKFASRPEQVERYASLIQSESEKLGRLVEQILRYGSTRAGRVIEKREPIAIEGLIEDSLRASGLAREEAGLVVDKRLEPGMPLVLADEQALKHALQNLLENAHKYGTKENNWIGIFAAPVSNAQGRAVEIRVVDRGPGIPREEQNFIFDPFFRGQRAVNDQLHGTGLGLNLAKKIIEAHGGTLRVDSQPNQRTEFIVTIPAAPSEQQNELAHSIG